MQDFTPTAAEVQNDMKMMKMVKKGFQQQLIENSRMSKQNELLSNQAKEQLY
jgi:hypothetical protein